MNHNFLKNMALAALFLAIGLVLPFFTGQIPAVGKMLLPMHIPVLLCGLICGWQWGLGVGFVLPVLRSVLFSMPVMYPTATAMAFELAAYGAVIGYLYARSKWRCVKALYKCLIPAMIAGRIVWGAVMVVLMGLGGNAFTWELFLGGALLNALPGIALQLDGAAGSDEAGALYKAGSRLPAGGVSGRSHTNSCNASIRGQQFLFWGLRGKEVLKFVHTTESSSVFLVCRNGTQGATPCVPLILCAVLSVSGEIPRPKPTGYCHQKSAHYRADADSALHSID